MKISITEILPVLTAAVGGLSGFLFSKHKRKAEVQSLEVSNTEKLLAQYRSALDDLTTRNEKKFLELEAAYKRKIKVLEEEILVHKRLIQAFKEEIKLLKKTINK